jgi:DNA-directed RNA polymerase II subunit RPB2
MTHVTIYSNSLPLYEYVMPAITQLSELTPATIADKVKVFINGAWVGVTDEPQELYLMLKDKKYKGILNVYTSVVFDYTLKEIRVCNDSGRMMRPLLRVKNNNVLVTDGIVKRLKDGELKWDNLLSSSVLEDSIIEYIDAEEQTTHIFGPTPVASPICFCTKDLSSAPVACSSTGLKSEMSLGKGWGGW